MNIGKRIKEARKRKGYTQKSLAAELGVTKGTISTWELDSRIPNMSTLEKLCEILNVSLGYFDESKEIADPWGKADTLVSQAMHKSLDNIEESLKMVNEAFLGMDCPWIKQCVTETVMRWWKDSRN